MRSFIALELSAAVQQALAAIQEVLRAYVPHARWSRPEGTHLTLKFLGEVQPQQVGEISVALDAVASRHQPLSLFLSGVGAFPRLSVPRVLWVGIESGDGLIKLQGDVETTIAPLGFPTENRQFKPHLTLARLEGDAWPPDLRQRFLDCSSLASSVAWQVDRIVLFRSELLKGGAVYTPVHVSPL